MVSACPSNMTSTDSLRERVDVALTREFSLAGRHVRVETHGDHVVLRGFVRSYYQKQMAQESLRSVPGVRQIRNEIEVITP